MSPESVLSAGTVVPADSLILAGAATVDESAVTGESAPVVREARPGRHTVLAGSRILTGWLRVRPLEAPVVAPRPRGTTGFPAWWPAAALLAVSVMFLLARPWTARAAGLVLVPPYLSLLALGAVRALESAFWRRVRVVPLGERALERAAGCDTLVMPTAAVWEDGSLVAIEFWPVRGVSLQELAGAARQGNIDADGRPGRSVVILARHRLGRQPSTVRDPFCGTPGEVAGRVQALGGAWPLEAQELERAILARGGQCLGVADGGRPLGLVELRPDLDRATLDDVAAQGIALSFVDDPGVVRDAVRTLDAHGRHVAVGLEAGMPEEPPEFARFVLAGPAWAASRPTALDLDADPSKLPEVLLGARRVQAQALALITLAVLCDAARVATALLPGVAHWTVPSVAVALGLVLLHRLRSRAGQVRRHGSGSPLRL